MFKTFLYLYSVKLAMAPERLGTLTSAYFHKANAIQELRQLLITCCNKVLRNNYVKSIIYTNFWLKEFTVGRCIINFETSNVFIVLCILRQI